MWKGYLTNQGYSNCHLECREIGIRSPALDLAFPGGHDALAFARLCDRERISRPGTQSAWKRDQRKRQQRGFCEVDYRARAFDLSIRRIEVISMLPQTSHIEAG